MSRLVDKEKLRYCRVAMLVAYRQRRAREQRQAALNAITGGQEVQSFIAAKQAETFAILGHVRARIAKFLADNPPPPPTRLQLLRSRIATFIRSFTRRFA